MTSARGIRNRNPGNIQTSGWTIRQLGYTGPEPQGRFATFDTMAHGVAALLRLLLVYRDQHGLKTVRGIINRWAPPNENDTSAYSITVAKTLGVGLDDELPADASTYVRLARAIVAHENGRAEAVAVTDEDYAEAAKIVFTQVPAPPAADTSTGPSPPLTPRPAPAPAPSTGDEPWSWPFNLSGDPMPIPLPAAIAYAGELLKLIPWGERNAAKLEKAAPMLVSLAKDLVPQAPNEQGAVEAVLNDRELQAQFTAKAAIKWADLAPLLDYEAKERAAARDFAERMTSGDGWRAFGYGAIIVLLITLVVGGGGWIMAQAYFAEGTDQQTKGMIIGAVIAGVTMVLQFFFGSSASSRTKDEALARQSRT